MDRIARVAEHLSEDELALILGDSAISFQQGVALSPTEESFPDCGEKSEVEQYAALLDPGEITRCLAILEELNAEMSAIDP